ncbi:transcriptional regulator, TetR family [Agromyces sp. CF514]|uniref:TetR/AcrR family transcriptional regulator n=1 Tax=Agromyces sp. CF514 TaxID=1881031 RepID=UPI0008E2FFF0|nr:TetR/AcrR family transcriptional regulator [Agromyces sp. CF514]SFR69331.1 transcriptional regulator, TetR family [Agromyces sp. CF514]
MPRLNESTKLQRREAIAAAAMRCFARNGFAGTSMADIIAEAGSSAGSVYSHFAGKAELVRYTASSAMRELLAAVSEGLPAERTPAVVLAHLLEASHRSDRAQSLLQIWADVPRDPELEEIASRSLVELRSHVREALLPWCGDPARDERTRARPEAAAEAIADALLTSVQGYLVRLTIDRDVDAELVAKRMTAVFERL